MHVKGCIYESFCKTHIYICIYVTKYTHIYIKQNLIISVHLHKKYPTVDTTKTIYYYRYYWQIVEKIEIK